MHHHAYVFCRPPKPDSQIAGMLEDNRRQSLVDAHHYDRVLLERWDPEVVLPVAGYYNPMIMAAPSQAHGDWRLYYCFLHGPSEISYYNEGFGDEPWRLIDLIETSLLYLEQGYIAYDGLSRCRGPNFENGLVYPDRAPWLHRR